MRKILTIASREYRAMVGTKAFLVSIFMMPVLMFGGIAALELMKNVGESKQRKIAVVDQSGRFFETLQAAAEQHNQSVAEIATRDAPGETNDDDGFSMFSQQTFLLERIETPQIDDATRLKLSDRIRNQELYAFVEIPANVLISSTEGADSVRFYAQDASLSEARQWVFRQINETAKAIKLGESGIPNIDQIVKQATATIPVLGMGLVIETDDGKIEAAVESDPMTTIFLPMGVMLLMFMVIFMAAQPMLESVLEEKSQRIAEVLLGSASPFQLMCGKLLGTVAGSLTVFGIYLAGAYFMAYYRGWTDIIPFQLTPWFIVFQIVGVLFYASIFMAVGASVSQLKEAQSMLLPVWMLLMCPMFVWIYIVRDPMGKMATWFSLFPPATPTTMMLRMATGFSIPWWQPVLGLILTLAATLMIVVLAGRIFRVGILWQGKTPKLTEILRWAFSSS